MPEKKPFFVDVLLEGSGGDLVFVPVEMKKNSDIKKLLKTRNTVISENLKREIKLRKPDGTVQEIRL